MIPETVSDALAIWDAGDPVFSVEMGGLGPGYEMAIQGLAFELMRELKDFSQWDDDDAYEVMEAMWNEIVRLRPELPKEGFEDNEELL